MDMIKYWKINRLTRIQNDTQQNENEARDVKVSHWVRNCMFTILETLRKVTSFSVL